MKSFGQKIVDAEQVANQDHFTKNEFKNLKANYEVFNRLKFKYFYGFCIFMFILGLIQVSILWQSPNFKNAEKRLSDSLVLLSSIKSEISKTQNEFVLDNLTNLYHEKYDQTWAAHNPYMEQQTKHIITSILSALGIGLTFWLQSYLKKRARKFVELVEELLIKLEKSA